MKALFAAALVAATASPALAQWAPPRPSGYSYFSQQDNSYNSMQSAPLQYLGQPGPAIRRDSNGNSYCSTPNSPQWCIQR